MKRIVIRSDTHGLLYPEVLSCLTQADAIIHGGDINTQAIADTLQEFAPLYIVRGNNDKEWAENLPHSLTFAIEGIRFFLVHNKRDLPLDLSDVDVVVYGHSHKCACEERDGVLWLKPGSCGRRRFDQEITLAVMTAEDGQFQVEKVTIVLYNLSRLDWERLPGVFREGLERSLSASGFPADAADLLCGSDQPLCGI